MADAHSVAPISELVHLKSLLQEWSTLLPQEACKRTSELEQRLVDAKLKAYLGSEDLLEALKEECNPLNLVVPYEPQCLEEQLSMLPPLYAPQASSSSEPQSALAAPQLETLQRVRRIDTKNNSNNPMKAHMLSQLRLGYRRRELPEVDLSHKNDCELDPITVVRDEICDQLWDLSVTVLVCATTPTLSKEEISRFANKKIVHVPIQQRIQILGSQNLSQLAQSIYCRQDHVALGDCSDSLNEVKLAATRVLTRDFYPGAFFFIEGTFYEATNEEGDVEDSAKLTQPIVEWLQEKPTRQSVYGAPRRALMSATRVEDLSVHLGKYYLYQHLGNCAHKIIFSDAKLVHKFERQEVSAYPMTTGIPRTQITYCRACVNSACQWLVRDSPLTPEDPCPLCDHCLRSLLYDEEGNKKGDFYVFQFLGKEAMWKKHT